MATSDRALMGALVPSTSEALAARLSAQVSPAQWAQIAQQLVKQDLLVLPKVHDALPSPESLDPEEQAHRRRSALALAQHWVSLGYTLRKADVQRLCLEDTTTHAWMHKHLTPALRQRLGAHVRLEPMYPNFPKQVMSLDDAELLANALAHYGGVDLDIRWLPDTPVKRRKPLAEEDIRARPLRLADVATVRDTLEQLVQMNVAWGPDQIALAQVAAPLILAWDLVSPTRQAPQRENQARLAAAWLAQDPRGAWPAARVSATDVLRTAVAFSGGDPSLAASSEKVKFSKLSRPQRRALLGALEQAMTTTRDPLTELHAYRQTWLRLAERLHPGEFTQRFPQAAQGLDQLRNGPAPISWHGQLDALLAKAPQGKTLAAVQALMQANPGYTGRSLRRLLAWAGVRAGQALLDTYATIVDRIETPVLLSLDATLTHHDSEGRVILPKGQTAWRYTAPEAAALDPTLSERAFTLGSEALLRRFGALAPLGKTYVEPGLDAVLVPRGLRSASPGAGVAARGSWLPVGEEAPIVRLFLWWKDTDQGYVDVDLSGVGLNDQFYETETCNFQQLRGGGLVHSGDLTSAPNGAAEFIDVHLDHLREDTRYVVLAANVYSGPAFGKLPECFLGWQTRSKPQRGEVFDARTVAQKFDATAPTKGMACLAFDVKLKRVMILDMPLRIQNRHSIREVSAEIGQVVRDLERYAQGQPALGRLIDLHLQARGGKRVTKLEKADTVFSLHPMTLGQAQQGIVATQPLQVASALLPTAGPRTPDAPPQALEATHTGGLSDVLSSGGERRKAKARR